MLSCGAAWLTVPPVGDVDLGHGILGTASPPSLERTMGGLDHVQAWHQVPRTTAGGGLPPQVHTCVRIPT